ncbi:NAD-dependent epimerase/dehydratase family protein [Halomarina oriensis]|uniref:NAD(P)H-binding protein n=1 Tax=Halomarina oriensis TaxID=671145 RepID=A0A6B0GME1_9EURY|nr:NAD(P)H-binding protein [Halomarina oriensis]
MKVGVVGANGSVGMELSVLLEAAGVTVVPVVRTSFAGAFLDEQGFDVRVGDVTDSDDADRLLGDVDVVVVSARTSIESNSPSEVERINEAIVTGAVSGSPADATAVLFSSVAVFQLSEGFNFYGEMKRHEETVFEEHCEETGRDGYVLRLGHVLGPQQNWTDQLVAGVEGRDHLSVAADAERPSNVLHTVTLRETVLACARASSEDGTSDTARPGPEPGTYTCVNRPQWTWRDVFEFYADSECDLRFLGSSSGDASLVEQALAAGYGLVNPRPGRLYSALKYAPDSVYYRLRSEYYERTMRGAVGDLTGRSAFELPVFAFESAPGPTVTAVPTTRTSIRETDALAEAFAGRRTLRE